MKVTIGTVVSPDTYWLAPDNTHKAKKQIQMERTQSTNVEPIDR